MFAEVGSDAFLPTQASEPAAATVAVTAPM
jgi:hypothetical protein